MLTLRPLLRRRHSTRWLSSEAHGLRLRRPSRAVWGSPADVPEEMPLLAQLSFGATRGRPGWVPASEYAELEPRRRSASWLELTYPFSSDAELRDHYLLGASDSLRAGMFLEELDAFSADCAYRHATVGPSTARPLTVVTAAHDGLHIVRRLRADIDLRLRGAVVWVGKSSMEVRTDLFHVHGSGDARGEEKGAKEGGAVEEEEEEEEEYLGSCFTLMVARTAPPEFAKALVPPLIGGDRLSAANEEAAAARRDTRRRLARTALSLQPPSATEVPLLHELWRRTRSRDSAGAPAVAAPASSAPGGMAPVAMSSTEQRALDIMQPTHRNMNGVMFGGYLMRRAVEVAWLSAFRYCRFPPEFAGVDEVVFRKPIEVGMLVELTGRVVFAAPDGSLRVYVEAHRIDLAGSTTEPTNEFHLVFHTRDEAASGEDAGAPGEPTAEVQPRSYEEGMLYLEGRRRWILASTRAAEAHECASSRAPA